MSVIEMIKDRVGAKALYQCQISHLVVQISRQSHTFSPEVAEIFHVALSLGSSDLLYQQQGISNSKREASASKSLLRRRVLVDLLVFHPVLGLALHLLTTLLLVVLSLHFLKFTSESLNFILVLIDLSLVHVKLSCHSLHLVGLFLQILLIN